MPATLRGRELRKQVYGFRIGQEHDKQENEEVEFLFRFEFDLNASIFPSNRAMSALVAKSFDGSILLMTSTKASAASSPGFSLNTLGIDITLIIPLYQKI
ncbi:MAG: hypothetical protein HQK89_13835 [Nitrospirae bacterium]|nr:hypothetical protein [Nitrospirota bacterium]